MAGGRGQEEAPGGTHDAGRKGRPNAPPLHVSYALAAKGLLEFLTAEKVRPETFGPSVGVSEGTGKRILTTLGNLGFASLDNGTGAYVATRAGKSFANSLNTPAGSAQLKAALERLPRFQRFWDRVASRSTVPDTALLKDVLSREYGAATKAASNLASILMGYARAAGYVDGSGSDHDPIQAEGRSASPRVRSRRAKVVAFDPLGANRLFVLMALAQSTPGKRGELAHKAEIRDLLNRGPFLPRGPNGEFEAPTVLALEATLRIQLRRALEGNDKTTIAGILEILETVGRGSRAEGT